MNALAFDCVLGILSPLLQTDSISRDIYFDTHFTNFNFCHCDTTRPKHTKDFVCLFVMLYLYRAQFALSFPISNGKSCIMCVDKTDMSVEYAKCTTNARPFFNEFFRVETYRYRLHLCQMIKIALTHTNLGHKKREVKAKLLLLLLHFTLLKHNFSKLINVSTKARS